MIAQLVKIIKLEKMIILAILVLFNKFFNIINKTKRIISCIVREIYFSRMGWRCFCIDLKLFTVFLSFE